jgi:hypothetical protein
MTEYISVDGGAIARNAAIGSNAADPPIRIDHRLDCRNPRFAHEIRINAPCRLVYQPTRVVLPCGARLVIEAPDGSVEIIR